MYQKLAAFNCSFLTGNNSSYWLHVCGTCLLGEVFLSELKTYFLTSILFFARVLLTSQELQMFPVSNLCCMTAFGWSIGWSWLSAHSKSPSFMPGFHGKHSKIKNAAIVTDNRKWREAVWLLLEASATDRLKRKMWKTAILFLQQTLPLLIFFFFLPCPSLWPALVLSLQVETSDSGFPFSLDKGVIRTVWVMPVHLWSYYAQLSLGSFKWGDQVNFRSVFDFKTTSPSTLIGMHFFLIEISCLE